MSQRLEGQPSHTFLFLEQGTSRGDKNRSPLDGGEMT